MLIMNKTVLSYWLVFLLVVQRLPVRRSSGTESLYKKLSSLLFSCCCLVSEDILLLYFQFLFSFSTSKELWVMWTTLRESSFNADEEKSQEMFPFSFCEPVSER